MKNRTLTMLILGASLSLGGAVAQAGIIGSGGETDDTSDSSLLESLGIIGSGGEDSTDSDSDGESTDGIIGSGGEEE